MSDQTACDKLVRPAALCSGGEPETSAHRNVHCGDRHQSIMSIVALTKGVEEPWTLETVVRFIDLFGYREITLKTVRGASTHCVQKPCGRNVPNRGRNRGCSERRQAIERLHREHSHVTTWNHPKQSNVTFKAASGNNSEKIRQCCRGWWNTQAASYPAAERSRREWPSHEFVPFCERNVAETDLIRTT